MTYKTTHNLNVGDTVAYHGCKFKLTERFNRKHKDDLKYDEQGVTWFRTECIDFEEGSMPKNWAEDWVIQGNKNASWKVI